MNPSQKTLVKILDNQKNISFKHVCEFLIQTGFHCRVKGSHHIFTRQGIPEIINLQPQGSLAKRYQIKQIRNIILKYNLHKTSSGNTDEFKI
ncbi:MAG: type II toxin-antitoxin system HicA family toxin [Spirochaetia bacterium]|nr:type II toxin-antitoxin system HicA family toxin [Spirochaetia bacterium]